MMTFASGSSLPGAGQDLHAVGPGQVQVGEDQVEPSGVQGGHGHVAVGAGRHLVALLAQGAGQGHPGHPFVFHQQDLHGSGSVRLVVPACAGRVMVKVVPAPGSLATSMGRRGPGRCPG